MWTSRKGFDHGVDIRNNRQLLNIYLCSKVTEDIFALLFYFRIISVFGLQESLNIYFAWPSSLDSPWSTEHNHAQTDHYSPPTLEY